MKKIAIVGSRTFTNYKLLKSTLNKIDIKLIISGGAKGADLLSEKYAKENTIKTLIFYHNWKKYGKAAGLIRNKDIVKNADIIIAFWDGFSQGTKHSILLAQKYKKKLIIIKY